MTGVQTCALPISFLYDLIVGGDSTGPYIGPYQSYPLRFNANNIEVMRIDTSGNFLVGTTNSAAGYGGGSGFVARGSTGQTSIGVNGGIDALFIQKNNTGGTFIIFYYGALNSIPTGVGSISTNGTNVSFNTSSDYRLKTNVQPMTTGLATISQLKPVTYDWISDKSKGEGFIAHELQAVIPHAVTGEKDAVDENGKIKPQGVDYSKVVVHLVAAIQELSAKLAALEAKVGA